MQNYEATLGIRETGKNARVFMKNNQAILWSIFKPFTGYILALLALDLAINMMFFTDSEDGFMLGAIVSSYFYAALMISWHRVIIEGPDKFIPVDPFKPKKHELVFMGMAVLLSLFGFLIIGASFGLGVLLGKVGMIFGSIIGIVLFFYLIFRFSFYFPAKAVNTPLTLKEAFKLSKGYALKFYGSSWMMSWRVLALSFIYLAFYFGVIMSIASSNESNMESSKGTFYIAEFFLTLPLKLYFDVLLYTLGVTALSNYYLWATKNPK